MEDCVYTITYGDQAENHKGMQIIGKKANRGFNLSDLTHAQKFFQELGAETELIRLNDAVQNVTTEPAYLLIVRQGINFLLADSNAADQAFAEQEKFAYDSKAFMYGEVRNKHARHNVCFGETHQEPDYETGKGTVLAFEEVPLVNAVRTRIADTLDPANADETVGTHGEKLVAEANKYFDTKECGIGLHGDSERNIVVGLRLGADFPLHYQWYQNSAPIGKRVIRLLGHGDMYYMSAKTVGNDWKLKKKPTLRHCAGYIKKYVGEYKETM